MLNPPSPCLAGREKRELFFPCRVELSDHWFHETNHQREVEPNVGQHEGDEMPRMGPTRGRGQPTDEPGFTSEVKSYAMNQTVRGEQSKEANGSNDRWRHKGQKQQGSLKLNPFPLVTAKRPCQRQTNRHGQRRGGSGFHE